MKISNRVSAIAIATVLAAHTARAEQADMSFDIEGQPVTEALQAFAEQSGYQMAFLAESAAGVEARPISGRFAPSDALNRMLEGTGLEYRFVDDRTIAILQRRADNSEGSRREEAGLRYAAADQAQVAGPLQQVAQAQTQTAQAQTQAGQQQVGRALELEEIVVTGSRIARTEFEAVSPLVSLGEVAFDRRGITKIEDELNSLPQVVGAQNSGQAHGSSGTATVDLRGLGDQRTLVLKNGKRLPFGSPQAVGANIDQIPSQLVERVEILTGGASAVYGADAVAGVVNFVMKDDFQGMEVDFQGGFHQTANDSSLIRPLLRGVNQDIPDNALDGTVLDLTVLVGTNFADDKGNVTMWFTYANDNEISENDRVVSACPLGAVSDTELTCIGATGNAFPGRFTDFGTGAGFNFTLDPQGSAGIDADGDGVTGLREFDNVTDTINFNRFGVFQRPRERFTLGASTHYDFTENHEFFLDVSFVDNSTHRTIAPSATFFETDNINCDNPLLSVDQQATFCQGGNTFVDENGVERGMLSIGRGFLAADPRFQGTDIQTFRVVGGFRGELWDGVDYELFGQFAKTDFSQEQTDFNLERIRQALDVIRDPQSGEIRCRDRSNDCVPLDIFSLDSSQNSDFKGIRPLPFTSNVSQEALDFIELPVLTLGETNQTVIGGNVSSDLTQYGIKSPFADSGIQAVLGFEYRRDQLRNNPDFAGRVPLAAGFGGPIDPVEGKVTVYEFFGEAEVPLVEGAFLMEKLTANAAYRFSDYTVTTGTGNTYTMGTSWQITSDIRARGQFARAVRAPNPVELFTPQSVGLFSLTRGENGLFEPCAGDFDPNTPNPEPARTFEECARTGVTAAQFGRIQDNPAGQFNQLQGGNPDLEPEKANTWTAGVIFTPNSVPGLSLTLDWYSIKLKRAVATIDPGLILNGCLDSGQPVFCDLINRGNGGRLFFQDDAFIESTNLNTGSIRTKGIDLDLNYNFDLEDAGFENAGAVDFRFLGTWLDEFQFRPLPKAVEAELADTLSPQAVKFDCTGFFGSNQCNRPRPEFRWRFSTTWLTPWGLDVTTTWRYFDSVTLFGGGPAVSSKLSSTSFIDLSFNYQVMDNVRLRMGVNNLVDKDPPVSSEAGIGFAEGNTFPGTFDVKGRFFFGGLTISL